MIELMPWVEENTCSNKSYVLPDPGNPSCLHTTTHHGRLHVYLDTNTEIHNLHVGHTTPAPSEYEQEVTPTTR